MHTVLRVVVGSTMFACSPALLRCWYPVGRAAPAGFSCCFVLPRPVFLLLNPQAVGVPIAVLCRPFVNATPFLHNRLRNLLLLDQFGSLFVRALQLLVVVTFLVDDERPLLLVAVFAFLVDDERLAAACCRRVPCG